MEMKVISIKTNLAVRLAIMKEGIPQYKVAELCGMAETAFSRKMRRELPETEQNRIIEVIQDYARKSGEESA